MTFKSRTALAMVAATMLWPLAAIAADYEPPIVVDEAPEYVPVEVGSGWYLRGDLGYNFSDTPYDFSFLGEDADNSRISGGIGAGYHFNDFMRADLNIGFVSNDELNATSGGDSINLENRVWNGMANVYADLGTIAGFTPYVGGGIGVIYSNTSIDYDAPSIPAAFSFDETQYKVAYALGAGVAYRVALNTSVDVGYQYLSAPDLEYVDFNSGTPTVKKGVDYHQVKVGLRYDLW